MLTVFDLFSIERPALSTEEIMEHLGTSRGTAYRYVAELTASGFLVRMNGLLFLGPRIIELDYFIRQSDLDMHVVQPVLRALSEQCECDVLLADYFDDRIVVRYHQRRDENLAVSYGRGRRMPLFKGAASKAILAALPASRQKRLYESYDAEIREYGLGGSWKEFRASLSGFKKAGYVTSIGELDQGNAAVAAPISFDPRTNLPGSVSLIFSEKRFKLTSEDVVGRICQNAAQEISQLIEKHLEKTAVA
ncbi:IclR family transcriptional regulator [Sphingomonas sp.]|uniref:IclR family transcriptional regulator n=1 Tax=Sphingomonas sp. TaxID=28214 RepID=UPI002601A66B|nr:IclR family transcriptional regulator C-terminal domain-containing protein [Sphingomonas sp.]